MTRRTPEQAWREGATPLNGFYCLPGGELHVVAAEVFAANGWTDSATASEVLAQAVQNLGGEYGFPVEVVEDEGAGNGD